MIRKQMTPKEYEAFKLIACKDGDFTLVELLALKSLLRTKREELPVEVQKTIPEVKENGF